MSQRFLSIVSYTFNQNLWLNKGADVAGGSGGETELRFSTDCRLWFENNVYVMFVYFFFFFLANAQQSLLTLWCLSVEYIVWIVISSRGYVSFCTL